LKIIVVNYIEKNGMKRIFQALFDENAIGIFRLTGYSTKKRSEELNMIFLPPFPAHELHPPVELVARRGTEHMPLPAQHTDMFRYTHHMA